MARAFEPYRTEWIEEPFGVGTVAGPVGTASNVHFAIACPTYKVLEHFNDFADLVGEGYRVDPADGCFGLPTAPGLGLTLDRAVTAAHPAHPTPTST